MKLFDTVERENLYRREFQLLVLATSIIAILASGLALLAYPVIFSHTVVVANTTLKVCFFGFCALSILLVGYLWERHHVFVQLRTQIDLEQKRYLDFQRQAGHDFLSALPAFNQFQDRLVMEYRRAERVADSFSVLVIKLSASHDLSDPGDIAAAFGDAAKAVGRKLRREDTLYRFSSDAFGVILPELKTNDARSVLTRLSEGLRDSAGAANRFSFVVKLFNYPEHGATAHELELAVRALLPMDLISEPSINAVLEPIGRRDS
jgi:GGDEF domain-containing protein